MVAEFEIEDNGFTAFLGDFKERLQTPRVALSEMALLKERKVKLQFAQQKDPFGNPWAPLAPSTLKEKRRNRKPSQTLTRDATLKGGIAAQQPTANEVEVRATANSEAGIWHQTGTRKMPQRLIFAITDEDIQAFLLILERYLDL